jgi:hypothetical protein
MFADADWPGIDVYGSAVMVFPKRKWGTGNNPVGVHLNNDNSAVTPRNTVPISITETFVV